MITRDRCWVVTASDSRAYESMLIPFLASVIDVARWSGRVAVVDLGLTDGQRDKLKSLNISIFPKANQAQAMVCDRFFSDYNAMNDTDLYAIFDADIWFNESIDDLFENYDGKLHCTIDRNYQGFITGVIPDKDTRERYTKEIAEKVLPDNDNKPLQAGFLLGNKRAFGEFTKIMGHLIGDKIAADAYGTDSLALNALYAENRDIFSIDDISYNCLPDWQPTKIGSRFIFNNKIIRAIHQTSPYRSVLGWSFAHHYPDIVARWRDKMLTIPTETEVVVVKGNNFTIRKGTWDHTILYHDDYQVPKLMTVPENGCFVDIGGHIGGFTKLVATAFPKIPIFTFEPDPSNFALLKKNTAGLSNVSLHQCGVGGSDTKAKIFDPEPANTGMYRLVIDGNGGVDMISPDTFFKIIGDRQIVFMKIDCEGGEWGFFDKLTPIQKERIWEIQGELHVDQYHLHPPFAKQSITTESAIKQLFIKMFPNFHVFIDGGRLIKMYNRKHVL